jgi:hypothetical protein
MITANMILDLIEESEEILDDAQWESENYDFCNGVRRHIAILEKELLVFAD